jgi:hypothetical protein
MASPVEAGFIIDLSDDLPDEVHQVLAYMIGQGLPGIEPPRLDHPLFNRNKSEGYQLDWADIISHPREDDEEMLREVCGTVLVDNQLAFRGVMHDDIFGNVWFELMDWLSSISSSVGLVGYCVIEDTVQLISFESEGICNLECDDYEEFEDLQTQIVIMVQEYCED